MSRAPLPSAHLVVVSLLSPLSPPPTQQGTPPSAPSPQLKYILGYSVPRKDRLHDQVKNYVANIHDLKWQVSLPGWLHRAPATTGILLLPLPTCGRLGS